VAQAEKIESLLVLFGKALIGLQGWISQRTEPLAGLADGKTLRKNGERKVVLGRTRSLTYRRTGLVKDGEGVGSAVTQPNKGEE